MTTNTRGQHAARESQRPAPVPAPQDQGTFRPIGIPAVRAAAKQLQDSSADEARRHAQKARDVPPILREPQDND